MNVLLMLGLLFFQVQPDTATQPTCVYQGVLPDQTCTPGVVDPAATLALICTPGYATSVRPPLAYTRRLKRQQMRAYGVVDQPRTAFEEDHLVPLELAGDPTDPANLWPEPIADARRKDRVEDRAHQLACSGDLDLAEAQQRIVTDWVELGVALGVL